MEEALRDRFRHGDKVWFRSRKLVKPGVVEQASFGRLYQVRLAGGLVVDCTEADLEPRKEGDRW